MKKSSEVVVVGGGPCGSFAALNLAKLGVKVAVFEEHGEIGVPSHCPGHLSINGLKNLGIYPLPPKIVENIFYGVIFHSPSGKNFSIRFPSPVTCTVNRVLFDKYVARKAENMGTRYFLNSRVDSLIVENGYVKGVTLGNGEKVSAEIVIDAEGISSRLLKQADLSSLNSQMLVKAVHAEVENVKNLEEDMVEVFLGRNYAPGFYAWLIPTRGGRAKVGLATKIGNPKDYLQRFMRKHPEATKKLGEAKILRESFHSITLGEMIPKAYSNGFLAVGDAASQVKPTTGGGVILGMNCARIAAEVVHEALTKNDCSSRFLSKYQKRCRKIMGFDLKVMLKMRKMLDALSDKKIDSIIQFCKKTGLDKALQNFKDIDFQGRSLLNALRNPRVSLAIFYFLISYTLDNS